MLLMCHLHSNAECLAGGDAGVLWEESNLGLWFSKLCPEWARQDGQEGDDGGQVCVVHSMGSMVFEYPEPQEV